MSDVVTQILDFFLRFGYASVFAGVILESLGLPIPAELVLILSGHAVEAGAFAFAPAVLAAAAGAVLSDSAWYFAGRGGAQRFIRLYCQVSFGSGGCIERTERNLRRFGAPSLIYARFVPGFRTFAAPMAGVAGISYGSFLLFDGIGALLWAATGVSTGFLFTREIPAIVGRLDDARALLLYLAAGAALLFLAMKWWVRRRHGKARVAIAEPESPGPLSPRIGGLGKARDNATRA